VSGFFLHAEYACVTLAVGGDDPADGAPWVKAVDLSEVDEADQDWLAPDRGRRILETLGRRVLARRPEHGYLGRQPGRPARLARSAEWWRHAGDVVKPVAPQRRGRDRRDPPVPAPADQEEHPTMEQVTQRLMSWASVIDPQTLEQARRTSELPFIHPHLALMPDAHLGKGATVGSVIPTLRSIFPAAVGVDIGCGMIAVRTQFEVGDLREHASLAPLREAIERAVPLSAGRYNARLGASAAARVAELEKLAEADGVDPDRFAGTWRLQLGSLGSGNHFIEITLDELGRVWTFLHSGSRGVGNKIAQAHIGVAQRLMERYWISLPDRDLAYLVEDTPEFWSYIRDLRWAQRFALLNREEMTDRVVAVLADVLGEPVVEHERINCHHNFTQPERHFGQDVWVSRKGAIEAAAGLPGLVPGSMGTASYVVVGKGNRLSLNSSPHGAGRRYSRTAARKVFTQEDLRTAMAGIEYRDTDAFVDEIPSAYKDIDQVMDDARDLVEIRHTLRQVVNVKGD
jgi:tRNA-splicing ligase RtcB (3'-phosphate/5'-hydroxy nucleic acid ligase)